MDQTIDEQNSTVPTKPRNAWIAFFLSFFLPGLGQVYNGQIRKAAVFFTCIVLFPVFIALSGALNTFFGAILLMVGELAFKGFVILDAVVNALRQKEYVLKPYNKWYYYLLIGIVIFPALWVYDPRPMMGFQSFRIPTTSNSPTLQVGDYVMVNMKAYRKSEPDYGDIVVFKKDDGLQYLFRVVGRPNDRLELKDNIITINGNSSKATIIRDTISERIPVTEMMEELPNGHKHRMYRFNATYDASKTSFKDVVVPEDCFFLLGDNRDYALDSRYSGFVRKADIQGRILYSYWGKSAKRINIDFRDK